MKQASDIVRSDLQKVFSPSKSRAIGREGDTVTGGSTGCCSNPMGKTGVSAKAAATGMVKRRRIQGTVMRQKLAHL